MSRASTFANDLLAFRTHVKEMRESGAVRVFAKRGETEYLVEFDLDEDDEKPRAIGFVTQEPAVGGGVVVAEDFEEDEDG